MSLQPRVGFSSFYGLIQRKQSLNNLPLHNNTLTTIAKMIKKYQKCRVIMSLSKHIVSAQNTPCLVSKRLV
ncbi:hypothetical protein MGSAQ_000886 [marine sediment metagenome]|uniref:Uncharacterized protein n=1 Tax=marine sediment metagenome TaxID=412755 RepID=A0A1B6NXX0_9ZZZZ